MSNKSIIIAIVGSSGSGKTHMVEFLKRQLGIPYIVSMTTREKRDGEINGKDHWFVSSNVIDKHKKTGNLLAYTRFGNHEYRALKSDVPVGGICSYIVDEKGLDHLIKHHANEYTIISILVKRPIANRVSSGIDACRIQRDKNRNHIPEESFDRVIQNNGSIKEFEENILTAMK